LKLTVSPMLVKDWPAVARIYAQGIASGNATFEPEVPEWTEWRSARVQDPCLVARAESSEEVLGWAALSPVSSRPVYRGVGEIGIYVASEHVRQGVGGTLLDALIEASERAGFWTLQAGIFPENEASVALHESRDFQLVGVRRRVGQMPDGRWRDVAMFERRSAVVGASDSQTKGG
jgi:L-amino acid N-acyltransferase YncA